MLLDIIFLLIVIKYFSKPTEITRGMFLKITRGMFLKIQKYLGDMFLRRLRDVTE